MHKRKNAKKIWIASYGASLSEELRKVAWPNQEELVWAVKLVVASVLVLGLSLYVGDLGLKGCLDAIGGLFRLFF